MDGGCARKTLTCPRRIPFSTLVQSMADAALHSERRDRLPGIIELLDQM